MNFEYEEALKAQQKVGSCDVARRPPERRPPNTEGTQNPKLKTQNSKLSIARSPICFN
jgi:hypothetical protein